jgi:hypothetical protein
MVCSSMGFGRRIVRLAKPLEPTAEKRGGSATNSCGLKPETVSCLPWRCTLRMGLRELNPSERTSMTQRAFVMRKVFKALREAPNKGMQLSAQRTRRS